MYPFLRFFFFKQKTAYEMRISDWSSDVCSSDLQGDGGAEFHGVAVEAGDVDHLGAGDLVLPLGHAHFDEALAFARGVVFRVIGEVAVLARFGDGANDLGARRRLEITQLFFPAGENARRHGYIIAPVRKPSPQTGRPSLMERAVNYVLI